MLRPAPSWPRRRPACPSRSAGSGTGTTATCGFRDAAFCVYALLRLGFASEADAFVRFILRHATAGGAGASGAMQLMYGIDGRTGLPERELPHLAGYRGSQPVRIGNAAAHPLQLPIYGELMDS